jgi:hypothetical protein
MKKMFTILGLALAVSLQAAPKKLLVVETTLEYRHSSIPTIEKVLIQLGTNSGEFTVDCVRQPPGSGAELKEAIKTALQKLSPESLKDYDGVVFSSTTGDLPIPDKDGFLAWIKAGHAFIGIHAACDTFHGWPAYIDMLGGEFDHHGAQLDVECLNQDTNNPATAHLEKLWKISLEEVYQFKKYDPAKVHDLLILDKKPEVMGADGRPAGHFPVAWCKDYGAGKVFYTSLGHREDIIDTDPDLKNRKNSVEISKAYQAHLLGGIEWALGLAGANKLTIP